MVRTSHALTPTTASLDLGHPITRQSYARLPCCLQPLDNGEHLPLQMM